MCPIYQELKLTSNRIQPRKYTNSTATVSHGLNIHPIVLQLSRSLITFLLIVAFYPNHFRRARESTGERTSSTSSWLEILSNGTTTYVYVSDSTLLLPVSPVSERSIAASFPEEERRNVVSERGDQVEGTDLIIHPWRSGCLQPLAASSRAKINWLVPARCSRRRLTTPVMRAAGIISEQRLVACLADLCRFARSRFFNT